jgi:uncharacterized UBP type Zn finger protein
LDNDTSDYDESMTTRQSNPIVTMSHNGNNPINDELLPPSDAGFDFASESNPSHHDLLLSMGFSIEASAAALKAANNNVDLAVHNLLDQK